MNRPPLVGLRHLALRVPTAAFDATVAFYRDVVGMAVQWQPDVDNVYLSSGTDNLALHRGEVTAGATTPLDHLGFFMPTANDVEAWHACVLEHGTPLGATIAQAVKLHRDGATSFYARDPAGHLVQFLHVP
jgi:catechol 2,3-dioxygenase-like lactoylglutathione lyase family enzyme